jgi:Transcriptional regulator, AbiEi antitoxin, Type IV TA system/Transcriptional regulator, AbiEi antitoxin N-terminal domain
MTTENQTKINRLLQLQPPGVVWLSGWLSEQGFNADLQIYYRRSGWFTSIGTGAMIRTGDEVAYPGAVHALQKQAGRSIHLGGKTALALLGMAHYLSLAPVEVTLFGRAEEELPAWFRKYDWQVEVNYFSSGFLPAGLGMTVWEEKNFSIQISGAARALLECLYLVPDKQEMLECYQLMEGLSQLRPSLVQALLEACNSVKVKRLFLYFAEKAGHSWLKYLDLSRIELGSGKRSLAENGVYIPKYQMTVPHEVADYDQHL